MNSTNVHTHTICVTIVGNMAISYCCVCGSILDVKKIEEEPCYSLTGTIYGINGFSNNEFKIPDEYNDRPEENWENIFLNKLDERIRKLFKESQKNSEK